MKKAKIKILLFTILILLLIFSAVYIVFLNNSSKGKVNEENIVENVNIENILTNEISQDTQNVIEEEEEIIPEILTSASGDTYSIIGNINIPSLNIDYPIISKYTEELLKIAPTKYWGADPNEVGNMVILAHNYKSDKFFSKLPNIKVGDIIKITDLSGKTLDYGVYETDVVEPDDNSSTSQKTNGNTEVTLITCYYESGTKHAAKRFVAKARTI